MNSEQITALDVLVNRCCRLTCGIKSALMTLLS